VVALSADQGGAGVVACLVRQVDINYPVLMADKTITLDFGDVVTNSTFFLVNRNGHAAKKYPGFAPRAPLERDIDSVR
jgi:hypothetical protein